MNRKLAIGVCALALLALLAYSLERTAWLFQQFESWWLAAYAAAVVVELAAVALIVGASAIAGLDKSAQAWANRALFTVLIVQAFANLSAGYLRGGSATLAQFGSDVWALRVTAALMVATNLAVPILILCLSKLTERLLSAPLPATGETPVITVQAPAQMALQAPARAALPLETSAPVARTRSVRRKRVTIPLHNDDGSARWPCPQCGAALASGRAVGAAKTNGGCKTCRKAADQ